MFFPEDQVRVFLYGQPVNMRLSFDGLYTLAKHVMHQDPLSGHLFAFINRRATLAADLLLLPRDRLRLPDGVDAQVDRGSECAVDAILGDHIGVRAERHRPARCAGGQCGDCRDGEQRDCFVHEVSCAGAPGVAGRLLTVNVGAVSCQKLIAIIHCSLLTWHWDYR